MYGVLGLLRYVWEADGPSRAYGYDAEEGGGFPPLVFGFHLYLVFSWVRSEGNFY